jgi:predicted MPP superfamily phosphohydrolase
MLFHVLMLVVVGVVLYRVWRHRSLLGVFGAASAVVALAGIIAAPLGEGLFGMIRLLAWGVFFYLPLTLVGSAILVWPHGRRASLVAFVGAVVIGGVAIDAFLIEPTWLEVTHVSLASQKLASPLKVAIVADLQTDRITDYERGVLEQVLVERPDVILLAGDYLQIRGEEAWEAQRDRLNQFLREIDFRAPLGAYAVGGNVDPPRWPEIFAHSGITALETTRTVDLARDDVCLTGLSMDDSFNRQAQAPAKSRFHIALGHSPDFSLSEAVHADLLVAGHTHGGQVRLPVIGPLITLAKVPRAWAAGVTGLSGGRHLVVSRGIGMERGAAPRMRFLCRPQLVLVTIEPAAR